MLLTYGRKPKYTNFVTDYSLFLNINIQKKLKEITTVTNKPYILYTYMKSFRKIMEYASRGDDFSFIEDCDNSFEYIQGKCSEVLLFGNLTFNKVSYWVKDAYYCRDLNVNNLKNIHVPCTGLCFQIDKYNNR